jgi:hypothetical protein
MLSRSRRIVPIAAGVLLAAPLLAQHRPTRTCLRFAWRGKVASSSADTTSTRTRSPAPPFALARAYACVDVSTNPTNGRPTGEAVTRRLGLGIPDRQQSRIPNLPVDRRVVVGSCLTV